MKYFLLLILIVCCLLSIGRGQSLSDSLIVHYPFDNNANDASGNGNHGIEVGNIAYIPDRNGALSLNGLDSKIDLPNLMLNFPVTFAFWMKPDLNDPNYVKYLYLSDHWNAFSGNYNGFSIQINTDGRIHAHFGNGSGGAGVASRGVRSINPIINDSTWQFIAVTFVDYDDINIYYNGNLINIEERGNLNLTSISFQNEPDEIGADDYSTGERFWKGDLDDFRIYNRILTEQEINSLYYGESAIAYYPFNNNANDASGNGNHGIEVGNIAYIPDRNGALSLNGLDSKIDLPNLMLNFPVTFAFWMKPDLNDPNYVKYLYLSDHWNAFSGNYNGFSIQINTDGRIHAHFGNGSGGAGVASRGVRSINPIINDSTWQFIAVTFVDYDDINIYYNGNLMNIEERGNLNLTSISFQNEPDEIGADDYSTGERFWKGDLDDFRIYNRILNDQEIDSIYFNDPFTQIITNSGSVVNKFEIYQNHPNPFNPNTIIKYSIKKTDNIKVLIYNSLGQKVKTLVKKVQSAGMHELTWDATDDNGNKVGSGTYFYQIQVGEQVQTLKMIYLK